MFLPEMRTYRIVTSYTLSSYTKGRIMAFYTNPGTISIFLEVYLPLKLLENNTNV